MAGFYDSMVKDFKAWLDETFSMPTFYEGSVPTEQELPYAVFSVQFMQLGEGLATVNIYYRGTGLKLAMDAVDKAVSEVRCSKRFGELIIDEGSPVAQVVPMDDIDIKHVYMTFKVRHLVDASYL